MAVGLSLSFLGISIWWPAVVIGLVCAALTAAGLHLGRLAGAAARLGRWAEALGGAVLLAIGARILAQHGVF
jgi:putative Mn2+ efflux pump MntP